MDSTNPNADEPVTLVTVTYGQRWHLLEKVLDAVFADGVRDAVVIDNGSADPIAVNAAARYGDRVEVLAMGANRGSAPAFRRGIERACERGPAFLLLLDDDNLLASGSLPVLRKAYAHHHRIDPARPLVVLAFRPDNQADVANGSRHRVLDRDAFIGFNVLRFPGRLLRRITGRRAVRGPVPKEALLDVGPYGGMLFAPALVDAIGLPDPSFVLYGDDTEWSWRVTTRDGQLLIATDARITDAEISWNLAPSQGSGLKRWLVGGSEISSYYALRNRVYFETHKVPHSAIARTINRAVVLAAWRWWARRLDASPRLRLLMQAVADGEAGRLGMKEGLELR